MNGFNLILEKKRIFHMHITKLDHFKGFYTPPPLDDIQCHICHRGRRDRVVVGFMTTYAISAYHH
jgi:hypothetical protein